MSLELGGREESVERNILIVDNLRAKDIPSRPGSESECERHLNKDALASCSNKKVKKGKTVRKSNSHGQARLTSPPPAPPSTSLSLTSSLRIQRRDSQSTNEDSQNNNPTSRATSSGKVSQKRRSVTKQSTPNVGRMPDVSGLVAVGTSLK